MRYLPSEGHPPENYATNSWIYFPMNSLIALSPFKSGLGWAMAILSWIFCVYYNIIITWTLYFLGKSFTSNLPWATCNNEWNTPDCYLRGQELNITYDGLGLVFFLSLSVRINLSHTNTYLDFCEL